MRDDLIKAHRGRSLSPDRPVLRGTTENPDTFFQTQEASNSFYLACPQIVQRVMQQFAGRTGRSYNLFDYYGDKAAERVIVLMGSGAQTVIETVEHLVRTGRKGGSAGSAALPAIFSGAFHQRPSKNLKGPRCA